MANSLPQRLFDFFVNRSDCYCLQRTEGGFVKVDAPLTLNVLHEHLSGKHTVGAYQLAKDNTVKYLCFDLDPEKLANPEAAAHGILHVCFEKKREADGVERSRVWPHSVLLEASRYPDPSYHVWILFNMPTPAKVVRWLGLRILELAGLNPKEVEVFPKQAELTPQTPYGNFVKLPLGKHQAANKRSRLLDFETFQPIPNQALFNCFGVSFSEADINKIMQFKLKDSVQSTLKLAEVFEPLPSEEENRAAEILAKYWIRGRRNRLEMAFLGFCIKKSVSYESARRIIEKVCNLTGDEEKTARLRLVDYHYRNRRGLGAKLAGASLLLEVVKEALG
jgi:hypothetical protein